jgi:2-polyprenyl-6-methoxyphenol hydroxylase-like FAD-dependent oxidoreductase
VDVDVIVVGAGPAGLMLAYELGLAGVRSVVLERRTEPDPQSRAGGVAPRTAEVLDARGLLGPLLAATGARASNGNFAALALDPRVTDSRHPWLGIAQAPLEAYLAEHLGGLGVPVQRGCEVTGVTPDDNGVTAVVAGDRTVRGRYLVAADGGHSTVRTQLGVEFPGTPSTTSAVAADVVLAPGAERHVRTEGSALGDFICRNGDRWTLLMPLGDGLFRLVFGRDGHAGSRDAPVTVDEVQAALTAVHGPGAEVAALRAASRFGDAYRQLAAYRAGRVLFAGDAAHIHPPLGGQGVNLGVQDAANLGWKLAATVRGWAPPGLLDTYHSERHPVAARTLGAVRAQALLMQGHRDDGVAALREIVVDLLELPDTRRYVTGLMAGLEIRYDMPGAPAHPLLGRRMPDTDLVGSPGRVAELFHAGRGVLVDFGGLPDRVPGWADRVDQTRVAAAGSRPAAALLVRPDGYVCWASDGGAEGLREALGRWFGNAGAPTRGGVRLPMITT